MKLPWSKNKSFDRSFLENVVVFGVLLMFVFLLLIIIWADYVFYKVNLRDNSGEISSGDKILDIQDIQDTVRLLDERATKFQEVLLQK